MSALVRLRPQTDPACGSISPRARIQRRESHGMGRKLTTPAGVTGVVALAVSAAVSVTGTAASAHTASAGTASARTASARTAGTIGAALAAAPATTPIKHVIVIIGENHSFDNVFATYQSPNGEHVQNLLSEGIVTKN